MCNAIRRILQLNNKKLLEYTTWIYKNMKLTRMEKTLNDTEILMWKQSTNNIIFINSIVCIISVALRKVKPM